MKDEIKIIRLSRTDLLFFKKLIGLLNEVFEESHTIATDNHLHRLLDKPDFYAIVATINEIVIGGLTGYQLQKYYTNKSELYIYDIAVKTKFQNQGIGKKLIQFLKEYSTKNNIETIFVEAHSVDKQAVKFYESTFGTSEKVDHFNYDLKKSDEF